MFTFHSRITASIFLSTALLSIGVHSVLAADTTRPIVSNVSPTEATVGTQITFTVTYSDNDSGVVLCNVYVEFEDQGEMTLSNGVASLTHTFTSGGVYTVFVHCRDAAGNAVNGPNTAVVVTTSSSGSSGDTTSPTVSALVPISAQVNMPVTLQASYSDMNGVSLCRLVVNGFDRGAMSLSSGTASLMYTFDTVGSIPAYVQCTDSSGNVGAGPSAFVTVSTAAPPPLPPTAIPGLVKLFCPAIPDVNSPCRSVYYRGTDGLRHAFPNEKIYFTWYADFGSVKEISASEMASLPLGANVTYHPGVRMVKFVTDTKVYAVGRAGFLRWIETESLATALYGSDWNKKIDDLSDALVSDYTFGPEIMKASDYSPAAIIATTTSIDANF